LPDRRLGLDTLGPQRRKIALRMQLYGPRKIAEGTAVHVVHLLLGRTGPEALVEPLLVEVPRGQILHRLTRIRNRVAVLAGQERILEILQVSDARLAAVEELLLHRPSQLERRLLGADVSEAECAWFDLRLDTDISLSGSGWQLLARGQY
jgi:hypothetical protein